MDINKESRRMNVPDLQKMTKAVDFVLKKYEPEFNIQNLTPKQIVNLYVEIVKICHKEKK